MQLIAFVFAFFSCVVQSTNLECVVQFSEAASGIGALKYTFENSSYCEFLGIRYGTAERFQPSKLLYPTGDQNFTAPGSICPQLDDINYPTKVLGHEDCLFLNVFSPTKPSGDSLYPILVFIHGGSFTIGSAGYDVHGVDLLIANGIIIVSLNYRLDVLGFLRYPKFNISGNFGLHDQLTALQWIRQYIHHFGGDPSRVTLMGHSAGASSINYHMFSDQSIDLFQQAILLSGTFLMPHAFVYEPEKYSEFYFRQLGVSTREELMDRSFQDYFFLNDTSRMLGTVFASIQFPCFLPTADGLLVRDAPRELLMNNVTYGGIPLMVGTTSNEFLPLLDYVKDYFSWDVNFPNRENDTLLKYIKKAIHAVADEFVENHIFISKEQFFQNLANYANMIFPVDEFIMKMQQENRVSPIYRYRFDVDGKFAWYKNEFYRGRFNDSVRGPIHGDDLGYIFSSYNFAKAREQPEHYRREWTVHRMMVESMSYFIRHGNPSSGRLTWKSINGEGDNSIMHIRDDFSNSTEDDFQHLHSFWKRIHDCYYYYNCSGITNLVSEEN